MNDDCYIERQGEKSGLKLLVSRYFSCAKNESDKKVIEIFEQAYSRMLPSNFNFCFIPTS